jgi:subtilase family serine protease
MRTWRLLPLAPRASTSHEVYVNLHPGANVLRLRIDSAQRVAESNESNNAATLTVNFPRRRPG